MTPDRVFSAANSIALIAWLVMLLLRRKQWMMDTVIGVAVPALFAAIYIAIIAWAWGGSSGGFSSLSGVAALFRNDWLLLAGWIHYLAFDLLIGRWELVDAGERGIPLVVVVPCLVLTFLFGPAGWLLYTIVRFSAASRGARVRAV